MNPTPLLIAALVAGALGALGGYRYADAQGAAELARVQRLAAEEKAAITTAAATRLIAANRLADDLTLRVDAADVARMNASKERDRALKSLTTGRACLDGTAVRLLNQSARADDGQLPAAADQSADTATAAASDSDVALWIGTARDYYDACRGRIDALAEWRAGQVAGAQ